MIYNFYGNNMAKQLLLNINKSNCLSHAYLIFGQDGLGKKTFAKLLAMTIMCESNEKPCYMCKSCRKIMSDNHPDIKFVLGGDTKNSLHIEKIREIKNDCIIKPNESEFKIYIIPNIQNMTIGAFNAFLKTLEEPPQNVIFILTANNIDLLPQTIISRISPVQLFPLSAKELEVALKEEFKDSDIELIYEKIENIVPISNGNMGLAKKYLLDEKFLKLQSDSLNMCKLIAQKKEYPILKYVTTFEKNNKDFYILLEQILIHLREVLLIKVTGIDSAKQEVYQLALSLSKTQVFSLIEFIEQAKIKIQTNVNQKLMLATFVAGLKEIIG